MDQGELAREEETSQHLSDEFELTMTRAGRVIHLPKKHDIHSMAVPWDVFHDNGYLIQDELADPFAFNFHAMSASSNPDVVHLGEAMKAADSEDFRIAMAKEVQSHSDQNHWQLMKRSEIPPEAEVPPAVWAMRRKRRISTQEMCKWKARLNLHGGKQTKFLNFWETCGPVVGWTTIRMFLILMILNDWKSKQVDFVLEFPQANTECEMHMEVPQGFHIEDGSKKDHCLLLKKNVHGQKQAGRVWNQFLHDGLLARGFRQSKVDMCVHCRGSVMLLVCVDDGTLMGPNNAELTAVCDLLTNECCDESGVKFKAFEMTDEGDLSDYLGVQIERLDNGTIKSSQPHLITQIIKDVGFDDRTKPRSTPALSSVKVGRDVDGSPFDEEWDCRSVVGELNFLEKSTRCDMSHSMHQCARHCNEPKQSHADAAKRIVRHLVGNQDKGITLDPRRHSFDCFVDADFADFNKDTAEVDPGLAKSRTGCQVLCAGCPMAWASKLQQECCLSATEAECGAPSEALKDVTFSMQLLEESTLELKWEVAKDLPSVHCKAFEDNVGELVNCKVFEDNSGCCEMARLPKMRPTTRHINVRMHHFREHIRKGRSRFTRSPRGVSLQT